MIRRARCPASRAGIPTAHSTRTGSSVTAATTSSTSLVPAPWKMKKSGLRPRTSSSGWVTAIPQRAASSRKAYTSQGGRTRGRRPAGPVAAPSFSPAAAPSFRSDGSLIACSDTVELLSHQPGWPAPVGTKVDRPGERAGRQPGRPRVLVSRG